MDYDSSDLLEENVALKKDNEQLLNTIKQLRKYTGFLHSCAASGEKPKSYEWFCQQE